LLSIIFLSTMLLATPAAAAAAKTHVISFGKTMPVKWFSADDDTQPRTMKVLPLQRGPVRVSFEPASDTKQTFATRGHAVDLVSDAEDDEVASK
jgi:hypothetical protein